MSLRHRLRAWLIGLHGIFLLLVLLLHHTRPGWMLALECFLLLTFIGGWQLINQAMQPLDYAGRFRELLEERNYAARLHPDAGDQFPALVESFNRMLEALYQERLKLGEQRGFLAQLLQATPSAVVVFDFDDRISLLNTSARQLLALPAGSNAAEGQTLAQYSARLMAPDSPGLQASDPASRQCAHSLLTQLGQTDQLPLGESRLLSDSDGRRYRCQRSQFYDRGFARHFLLIEEITEELASSEKATYEKLVRVLAHEVNNTVAATGSVLESLLFYRQQLEPADQTDFATAIDAVIKRNRHLGEFIERFTRVVKMPEPERRPADLPAMLSGILRLYQEPCRNKGIRLEWGQRDATRLLALDSHLMEQALLNIVKNAVEAVEATMLEQAQPDGAVRLELVQEQDKIRLSVIDSGNRLGEVPAGQLFSPFFTTKKGGQGIGLLFVREVLNRHGFGFRLAASSADEAKGETRFDIWIPAAAPITLTQRTSPDY